MHDMWYRNKQNTKTKYLALEDKTTIPWDQMDKSILM
jgi:hypothetical protein